MSAILVLWDIDHTLIENHGVNKETYALAFKLLTGREAEHRARTDGRTEPEIVRDMLMLHGIAPTADHVAQMPEALESATLANAGALRERADDEVRANLVLGGRPGKGDRQVWQDVR